VSPQRPPRRDAPGRFVTFEGGEGVGKSTQIRTLAKSLQKAGLAVVTTREPGGTPSGDLVRQVLLSGRATPFGSDAEAMLFAAARAEHVARVIAPALARGDWVLCDRFIDSTRVYQGGGGVSGGLIDALETVALDGVVPDLTIILDLPAEQGLARAATRRHGEGALVDRFEGEDVAIHEARRQAFLAIAAAEPDRCVVIDAAGNPAAVAGRIARAVEARLGVPLGAPLARAGA